MALLLLFALIAGAGTAITPCVLPILPALLSTAATGGRRRPVGIVLGLGVTFTVSIVALSKLVQGATGASTVTRDLAVVLLVGFGVTMLLPPVARRLQAPLSRLARFGPRSRGDGFLTGIAVGAALGFVCAPCAGPILATVIGVSARSGPTLSLLLIAVAYAVGLAVMLLLYAFGGRALLARIRRVARGHRVERALGVVLILTGIAMAFNADGRLDDFIARHQSSLPGFLFDPTQGLENSHAIQQRLAGLSPASRFTLAAHDRALTAAATSVAGGVPAGVGLRGVRTPSLRPLGAAPEFTDTQHWFNTPGDRPLTLHGLHGRVVLVDFWTYTCINCLRTLPFIEGLYRQYARDGLVVVGVETPEFAFEQDAGNVAQAVRADGITYPVVQDNDYGTWNAYGNQYWPADYLIDPSGQVRHLQFGEGHYPEEEAAVRTLLYESGVRRLPAPTAARAEVPSGGLASVETYLNPARDQGFAAPIRGGTHVYSGVRAGLAPNAWSLDGVWRGFQPTSSNDEGYIAPAAPGASITGGVQARDVYLVLTSVDGRPRRARVLLDGRPVTPVEAGTAVGPGGYLTVRAQTVYNLVKLPRDARFELTVELPPGVRAYDFTFG